MDESHTFRLSNRAFCAKFSDLEKQIEELPADKRQALHNLASDMRQRYKAIRKLIKQLHSDIADIRVMTKYMLFDLEATRRELADERSY